MLKDTTILEPFEHRIIPYKHQEEGLAFCEGKKFLALFMEMGTGKSKIMIDYFTKLFLNREIDGVMIVAPKSFYLNFLSEIETHMMKGIPARIDYWDTDMGERQRSKLFQLLEPKDDILDIVMVNVEALTTERGYYFAEMFARMHYTYMIVDESTCIKSHKAVRTKEATKIGQFCDYRAILTGTPMTQGPLDLWGQIEFLQPGYLGFKNFGLFKSHHATTRLVKMGNRAYEQILSYHNIKELQDKIAPICYRVLKSECLDLPEKTFVKHYIEHTPEQHKRYTEMKEEFLTRFTKTSMVSCESILSALMKLHQINCGHVIDDNGSMVQIPNNRLPALLSLIELVNGKVIIWCKFKQDIVNICNELSKVYGEDSVVHYYGETTSAERLLNLERFKRDPSCRFFVSNETGSKSITLVQSSYAIYYSYDHKLETWLQSQDRNHRIGQDKNVTYVSLVIRKTVDESILRSLLAKKNIADEVLDNWRKII